MSIPPSNIPPSSSGNSDSSSGASKGPDGKPKRKFDPTKRREEKEERPKKSHFDLAQEAALEQKLQQEQKLLAEEKVAGMKGTEAVEAKEAVARIAKLIHAMVEKMQVGTVGGKDFASLTLKDSPEMPHFFAGANLTLTQTDAGLSVQFSNFTSPEQMRLAIDAVEKNKEQLQQMMLNLQAKNVHITQMQIGTHQIALPQVRQPSSIFEAPPPSGETAQDRERREGERGGDEGGPKE